MENIFSRAGRFCRLNLNRPFPRAIGWSMESMTFSFTKINPHFFCYPPIYKTYLQKQTSLRTCRFFLVIEQGVVSVRMRLDAKGRFSSVSFWWSKSGSWCPHSVPSCSFEFSAHLVRTDQFCFAFIQTVIKENHIFPSGFCSSIKVFLDRRAASWRFFLWFSRSKLCSRLNNIA